jgi:hypothetical protein
MAQADSGLGHIRNLFPPNPHETHFAIDISLGSGCRRGNLLLPSTLLLEQAQMHWRDINCPQWSRMRVSFDGSPL